MPRVRISCASWPPPIAREPVTRARSSRCNSQPPANNTGPARRAAATGAAAGPNTAKAPNPPTVYRLKYMPSIRKSPWAKLTTRITPKISPSPTHISP